VRIVRIILSYFICLVFSSAVSYAGENINEIGKIIYSKETRSYHFIYLNDKNEVASHQLKLKNKSELVQIKDMLEKSVHLQGELDWKRGTRESFSLKEELKILQLELFELNVLVFDSRKIIQQEKYLSSYKEKKHYQRSGGIPISDTVANSAISSAAVAVGIAAGPMSLIPATLFGIYQLFCN